MSLIGVSRTTQNATMRARTEAAIRQAASAKAQEEGPSGRLAAQALIDPSSVVAHFLAHVATNPTVADATCSDCGHAAVDDGAITYVVAEAWTTVADALYPPAPTA